ncbi:MAG: helix-turn-helix transcriptional regulator [Lachnospiraceae bacterium]|jgi:transcriptional regulator with XRE-family HTH domain|nr:helix-turn-helix transcriptional regulator [Lachnospiraceae bacterium]
MQFHEKLRDLRISSGFTQHSMAERLEINDRSYQNYEYGKREPDIKTLILLSSILKVSLDELLCREDYLKSHGAFSDEC